MDEEDLAELREGQKMVDESDEMDLLSGTQAELSKKGAVDEPEKE
jgi:G patch domain-containing protein 1